MKPWPDERSVLVLDNCRIHHNDTLANLIAAAGTSVIYHCHQIDTNLIVSTWIQGVYCYSFRHTLRISIRSRSLSAHVSFYIGLKPCQTNASLSVVKQYLRRYGSIIRHQDPIGAIFEACGCVNSTMTEGWFRHAGYIV